MRRRGPWPWLVLTFAVFAGASTEDGGLEECEAELDGLALLRDFGERVEAEGAGTASEDLFLLQVRAQRAQPAAAPVHHMDPRGVLRDFGSMATRMRQGAAEFSYAVPSRLVRAVQALGGAGHSAAASCAWSAAAPSVDAGAGPVRSYEGVLTAEACLRWCLGESTCLAAVFESSTGTCHGVPDKGFELVVPDTSAVVANKKCSQKCVFSRPRSGKSPGSVLQNLTVRTLQNCQQLCMNLEDCLSTVFRATQRSCYLLPRAFDEKAEFAIDDAMMSNKMCRSHCSFEDPLLLSSQRSGIIGHVKHVSTLKGCQKECSSNTTCHTVLFQKHQSICHLLQGNSSGTRHFIGTEGSVISHLNCGHGDAGSDDGGDDFAAESGDAAVSHEDDSSASAVDYDVLSSAEGSADASVVAIDEPGHGPEQSPLPSRKSPSRQSAKQSSGAKALSSPKVLLDGQAYSGRGTENQTALSVSVRSGFSVALSASWYSLGSWSRVLDLTDGRIGDGSGELLRVSNVEDTSGLSFSVRAGGHESHVDVKDAIVVGVTSRFLFSVSSAGVLRVFRDGKLLGHEKGHPMQELAHGQLFLARPTVRQKRAKLHTFEGWLSGVCTWSREATWDEAADCAEKDSNAGTD